MNELYVNPDCGCPHTPEQHKGCHIGSYCGEKNCRCVDGTYYGKMDDPASTIKLHEHMTELSRSKYTRNSELLESFSKYCIQNPELRFWQALVSWAGVNFILFSDAPVCELISPQGKIVLDTFHMEKKNG